MELHVDPNGTSPASGEALRTGLPPRVEAWRRRTAAGAILTGFAFGLREALEPERNDAPIIVQVSGKPVDDLPVEAELDDIRPSESVVVIRPWLLEDDSSPRDD